MTDQADPSTAARIRQEALRLLAEVEASDDDFALPPLDERLRTTPRERTPAVAEDESGA